MSFNSKEFKKLKAEWDKKLLESGFQDIENTDGTLKASTDPRTISNALKEKEEREIYYTIARRFLQTHTFANEIEKKIWEGHTEGIGIRKIAKLVNFTDYKTYLTIINLKKLAGLKNG